MTLREYCAKLIEPYSFTSDIMVEQKASKYYAAEEEQQMKKVCIAAVAVEISHRSSLLRIGRMY
jgi:hypothetical protein